MCVYPIHEKIRSGIPILVPRCGSDSSRQSFCSAKMCGPLALCVSASFLEDSQRDLVDSEEYLVRFSDSEHGLQEDHCPSINLARKANRPACTSTHREHIPPNPESLIIQIGERDVAYSRFFKMKDSERNQQHARCELTKTILWCPGGLYRLGKCLDCGSIVH